MRCLSCNSYIADERSRSSGKNVYQPEFHQLFTQIDIKNTDRLVVHTGSNILLVSLLAALSLLPDNRKPELHFRILRPENMDQTSRSAHLHLAELIAANRAFLYSETTAFAKQLSLFGHDHDRIDRLEVSMISATSAPAGTPANELRVAVLGTLRAEKGYDRLASIALCYRALTRDHPAPELKYMIHAPVVKNERLAGRMINTLQKMNVSVDARLRANDPIMHEKFLADSHIVLLPYDSTRYTNRGSSLACDALANARPIVCQKNCALKEYIRKDNGIATSTDLDFAAAMIQIAKDYKTYSNSSVSLAKNFLHDLMNCSLLKRLNAN
jgi:glycosyltransferase involved in cell wall biosynthesis